MSQQKTDYDSPWKQVLETYFKDFVGFFFPQAHADIDWTKGYEFLDKELQQVVRNAELGRREVDKLVKVWRKAGEEEEEVWVLVHVEVQGQQEQDFARRMYVYNYRIFDRYNRPVVSMAVLADTNREWRPDQFSYSLWGGGVHFRFLVVKLLDYLGRWEELESSCSPFAAVVMAHLKAQETQKDDEGRKRWKLRLARGLYERGFTRRDVINLLRFIDWAMLLPTSLEREYWREIGEYEENRKMEYVMSLERFGIEKGLKQGIQQGIQQSVIDTLEVRFEVVPRSIAEAVEGIEDVSVLKMLHKKAVTIGSLEEFTQLLEETQL